MRSPQPTPAAASGYPGRSRGRRSPPRRRSARRRPSPPGSACRPRPRTAPARSRSKGSLGRDERGFILIGPTYQPQERGSGPWSATRSCWRRACRAPLRPATSTMIPASASPPPAAKASWPSWRSGSSGRSTGCDELGAPASEVAQLPERLLAGNFHSSVHWRSHPRDRAAGYGLRKTRRRFSPSRRRPGSRVGAGREASRLAAGFCCATGA